MIDRPSLGFEGVAPPYERGALYLECKDLHLPRALTCTFPGSCRSVPRVGTVYGRGRFCAGNAPVIARPHDGRKIRRRAGRLVNQIPSFTLIKITTPHVATQHSPSLANCKPPPLQRKIVPLCGHRLLAAEGARRTGVCGERGCVAHAAGGRRASVVVGLGSW